MTWAERAKAGVDAKHFQAALAQKSKACSLASHSVKWSLHPVRWPPLKNPVSSRGIFFLVMSAATGEKSRPKT